ncbi:MAG: hypothetical protein KVP17_004258 [Porospora cf. gigantea B]|uniref:uncharacterized protein n=1 Tax=Porospora cf. gigantea B TaxID=2853592 RepID=UPI003571C70F|nr:MAG: hypothetical protein KVP17_004258 [Porospora cf. gigantea B]
MEDLTPEGDPVLPVETSDPNIIARRAEELQEKARIARNQREKLEMVEREKRRLETAHGLQEQARLLEEFEKRRFIDQFDKEKKVRYFHSYLFSLYSVTWCQLREEEKSRQRELLRAEFRDRFGEEMPQESVPPKCGKEMASKLLNTLRSGYKEDPDGLRGCLELLKIYLSNIVAEPTNAKFQRIRRTNKAFQSRVAPYPPAEELLRTVGFTGVDGEWMVLEGEPNGFLMSNVVRFVDLSLQML